MPQKLRVGIVGAGLGGLATAIAVARAGAEVTVLEAAAQAGEIGAGIQIMPNVSRFLISWDVDKLIGDNLVQPRRVNTYTGSSLVSVQDVTDTVRTTGYPWYVVRRDHLLAGLLESARLHGAEVKAGSRVRTIRDRSDGVSVEIVHGENYDFDFLIGADGIKSVVRHHIAPGLEPKAPSDTAAYRATLPYERVLQEIPEARAWADGLTMDTWNGADGYVLTYPISGGRELNVVTCFRRGEYVTKMEQVEIDEFRGYYEGFHPMVEKLLKLVDYTQRWPLLQMPPMSSWSNEHKNVVLIGDACHCMQNHLGQGAATAIEDGAFLGRVISEVIRGTIKLDEAVGIYEKSRMPKAYVKQQLSYISGMLNTTEVMEERNRASQTEIKLLNQTPGRPQALPPTYRSWQIAFAQQSLPGIFNYDAESDADMSTMAYLSAQGPMNETSFVTPRLNDKIWGFVKNPDAAAAI